MTLGSMDVMVTADIADLQSKLDQAAAAVQANGQRMASAAAQVQQLNRQTEAYAAKAEVMRDRSERVGSALDTMQRGLSGLRGLAEGAGLAPLADGATRALDAVRGFSNATLGTGGIVARLGAIGAAAVTAYSIWDHWSDLVKAATDALDYFDRKTGLLNRTIQVGTESIAAASKAFDFYDKSLDEATGSTEALNQRIREQAQALLATADAALEAEQKTRALAIAQAETAAASARQRLATTAGAAIEAQRRPFGAAPGAIPRALDADLARVEEAEARLAQLRREQEAATADRDEIALRQGAVASGILNRPARPEKGAAAAADPELEETSRLVQQQFENWQRLGQSWDGIASRLDPGKAALEQFNTTLAAMDAALAQNRIDLVQWEQYTALAAEEFAKRMAEIDKAARGAGDEGLSLGRGFQSAFDGIVSGSKKASDALKQLETALAKTLERAFLTKPLENYLNAQLGGVNYNSILGLFGMGNPVKPGTINLVSDSAYNAFNGSPGALSGSFAAGGMVGEGSAYMVGEQGPEVFVPDQAGQIVPNGALGGRGTTINIDARGAGPGVSAQIDAVLARRLPGIIQASRNALIGEVNRGGAAAQAMGRRSA